jgi:AraC-like DNA-binding protein
MSTGIDRLSALLERFRVRAHLFHAGPLCGFSSFAAEPGRGFLHVIRRGEMVLTHRAKSGAPRRVKIQEPSLLFYPRPLTHDFHNAPQDGADFVCATLEFSGGVAHPLARALPPVIILPLASLDGIEHTLALLFAETEQVRCGRRLLADRLFDVLLLQILRWLLDHPHEAAIPTGLLMGLSHPQLAKSLIGIQERPGDPWTVDSMAAYAGMSRSAFAVAFKAQVGETPADHLAQWRLSIAQSKLREGASIKAIAQDLGYGSASALSRVFAQKVGVSPRAWLASL